MTSVFRVCIHLFLGLALALAVSACSQESASTPPAQQAARPSTVPAARIEPQAILDRIKVLSSDEYKGGLLEARVRT